MNKYISCLLILFVLFLANQASWARSASELKASRQLGNSLEAGKIALPQEDIQIISQLTLDLRGLQGYYHSYAPDRKELVVFNNGLFETIPRLSKLGKPVAFRTKEEIEKEGIKNYFIFERFEILDGKVKVYFYYPIEGIRGYAIFQKDSKNEWVVIEEWTPEV